MAKQVIDIGTHDNDINADTIRVGWDKANDNFTELYNATVEPSDFYFAGRTFRISLRAGLLYTDHTLTALGFAGTEGVDWEALSSIP